MALLGQLHHIDIKVAFTLKTALRAPELFLCLLPILRDSRERQAKPNSPNSLTFVRLVPKSAPGEGYSETRSREPCSPYDARYTNAVHVNIFLCCIFQTRVSGLKNDVIQIMLYAIKPIKMLYSVPKQAQD